MVVLSIQSQGWIDVPVRSRVLTGDVYAHWASDLKLDYDDPTSATVGSELVCSSITSGGDGADSASDPELGRSGRSCESGAATKGRRR